MQDDLDFDPEELARGRTPGRPGAVAVWTVRVLAGLGLVVGSYLTAVSLSQSGLPLGCGSGSGCDEVLRSRWSNLLGIPVGVPAVLVYVGVMACTFLIARPSTDRLGRSGLAGLAILIAFSAVWFIGLQLVWLKAICPWCMAEHGIGLATAAASFWLILSSPVDAGQENGTSVPAGGLGMPVICGVVAAVSFMLLQVFFSDSSTSVARLPAGENADSGPGSDRQLVVLNGELRIDVHELPVLGSPNAPEMLVLLYDYCCPHCRATHRYLQDGLVRYPDQYGVVLLPMPLDAKCNPAVEETEPRFEEACELARIALAVWRADRAAFEEFDRWLFEPERPRTAATAREYAGQLLPGRNFEEATSEDWISERIAADVAAYNSSGAQTIPVILSPSLDTVVGRPASAEELFSILEAELGLTAVE